MSSPFDVRARMLPFETLARLIHVHVRTLHVAAKTDGCASHMDTRTTFHRLRARATLADAETFLHEYFEKALWPRYRPAPLRWNQIPPDYPDQIRRLRRRLDVTQAQFAVLVGAARKALVYQWEARKRLPVATLLGNGFSHTSTTIGAKTRLPQSRSTMLV